MALATATRWRGQQREPEARPDLPASRRSDSSIAAEARPASSRRPAHRIATRPPSAPSGQGLDVELDGLEDLCRAARDRRGRPRPGAVGASRRDARLADLGLEAELASSRCSAISRCSSPMPERATARCRRPRRVEARVLASGAPARAQRGPVGRARSITFEMTGSGKASGSRRRGRRRVDSVSPVLVAFRPVSATMSPAQRARARWRSWRAWAARARRARLRCGGFQTVSPGRERARVDAHVHAGRFVGSACTLNASARRPASSGGACVRSPVRGWTPSDGRHVERRGQVVDHRVEQRLDAVAQRRAAQDRHGPPASVARRSARAAPRGRPPRRRELLVRPRPALDELGAQHADLVGLAGLALSGSRRASPRGSASARPSTGRPASDVASEPMGRWTGASRDGGSGWRSRGDRHARSPRPPVHLVHEGDPAGRGSDPPGARRSRTAPRRRARR